MYGLYIFLTLLWKQNGEIDVKASENGSQFTVLLTAILEKKIACVVSVAVSLYIYVHVKLGINVGVGCLLQLFFT